jgi:hypothetical protein
MNVATQARRIWWIVVLVCPVLLAASAGAAPAGRSVAHSSATHNFRRCCFELDVSVGSDLAAEYPCSTTPPDYDCALNPKYPNGGHFFSVQWYGREIVSYRVQNGRPLIGEMFAGQARIRVTQALDSGAWTNGDANQNENCAVFRSTNPRENDGTATDGFMKSWSLLEFLNRHTLDVHAGPGLDHVFGTKCGLGVDHHATNGSRSSWGGLNQPWVWDFPSWPARTWRTKNLFYKSVSKTLTPRVLQPGGFCWDAGTTSGLFVSLEYFPEAKLKARAEALDKQYPITAKHLRTFENYVRVGPTNGPGGEVCSE